MDSNIGNETTNSNTPSSQVQNEHLRYLKDIEAKEDKRQEIIENKSSQLVGQLGIIFSILGVIAPFIYDHADTLFLLQKICLVVLLVVSLIFFIISIVYALENLNIQKYKYVQASTMTVTEFRKRSLQDFLEENISDLIKSIDTSIEINNTKGSNLLKAHSNFKKGIVVFCLLILFYLSTIFCVKENKTLELKTTNSASAFKQTDSSIQK